MHSGLSFTLKLYFRSLNMYIFKNSLQGEEVLAFYVTLCVWFSRQCHHIYLYEAICAMPDVAKLELMFMSLTGLTCHTRVHEPPFLKIHANMWTKPMSLKIYLNFSFKISYCSSFWKCLKPFSYTVLLLIDFTNSHLICFVLIKFFC